MPRTKNIDSCIFQLSFYSPQSDSVQITWLLAQRVILDTNNHYTINLPGLDSAKNRTEANPKSRGEEHKTLTQQFWLLQVAILYLGWKIEFVYF